jgi:hypothetical protein
VTYKLLDSRLLRQRLETFLNFPRGGLEVCGAVYPLVRECLDNRANQKALADMRMRSAEGTVGMRCRVGGWTTDITAALSNSGGRRKIGWI